MLRAIRAAQRVRRVSYQGLPPALKRAVFERDRWRCRWCGRTNANGYDAHHIEYRRGYVYDNLDNLITLCRQHHDHVHDSYRIPKARAQEVLRFLISDEGRGLTGMAVLRRPGLDIVRREPGVRVGRLFDPGPS